MIKDYSNSERGNPLPPHGLLFPISSKGSLYAPPHTQDITYHSLCYTIVEHWLEQVLAQWNNY